MPPPSETRPRLTKLMVKAACSEATMKSQASAMSQPRPAAAPLTAAITGFGRPCSSATLLWVCPCRRQPLNATSPAGAESRSFMPEMSPPEQNDLPLPVSTTARTASSAATRSSTAMNSARNASLMALRTSGRLSVTIATASSTVSSTSAVMMLSLLSRP